jgi:hypothetical protein
MTTTVNESMRNGVDTATLFATIDAVRSAPEAARFQFRAHNEWVSGTHNRGTIHDHPAVLVGRDNGPTPVEYVLHALAACLTAGLANIAAARGIRLTEVRSTVAGDIDLNGILGLDLDRAVADLSTPAKVRPHAVAEKPRTFGGRAARG